MTEEIKHFIRQRVIEMRTSVLSSLDDFDLDELMTNPYLWSSFFGTNEFIRLSLLASLTKSMQTKFGNLLEEISIKICGENAKSGSDGIDLDIIRKNIRLLVSVKSGATWGNSQSTKKQGDQFKKAKKTISQNVNQEIISIMGICCSNKKTTNKIQYADLQICGQNYWYLISGEKDFFEKIIEQTAEGSEEFERILKSKIEDVCKKLIKDFDSKYCTKDMFSETELSKNDIWKDVIQKSCGNLLSNDVLFQKLL